MTSAVVWSNIAGFVFTGSDVVDAVMIVVPTFAVVVVVDSNLVVLVGAGDVVICDVS